MSEGLKRAKSLLATPGALATRVAAAARQPATDATTGLQSRVQAEQLIESIVQGQQSDKGGAAIAIFLVNRIVSLNARFGRKVGDEILVLVAAHLGRKLPFTSAPFRWSGLLGAELQVKKIAFAKLEKTFETGWAKRTAAD